MGKVDCEVSEGDQEVGLRPWLRRGGRSCCCLWWDTVLSEDSICFARFDLVFLIRMPRRALGLQDRAAGAALLAICSLWRSRYCEQFALSAVSPRSSLKRYRKACSSFCVWAAKTCLVNPSFL